jgi:chromosome segregation ATPase
VAEDRQIPDLVAALRDVEGALAEVNVQIARREERGVALSARVDEMQQTMRGLLEELRADTLKHIENSHGLELLDQATTRLQEDVGELQRTLQEHPHPCTLPKLREEFDALKVTVDRMDDDLERVLDALKLDQVDRPGLAQQVKANRSTLGKVAAIAAAVVVVVGLLFALVKTLGVLKAYLAP